MKVKLGKLPPPRRFVQLRMAALGACLLPCLAIAQSEIPTNDGWVTDLAGMLTPQEENELETLMQSYKDGSGHEIALLTVPDLGGGTPERYALEVARGWGIGEKERHNGALLLIARDERKIRIEVGRGLEGDLTDSISGRIIRNVMAPRFRQGRVFEGIRAGIVAMHEAAGGDYASIPENGRGGSRVGGGVGLLPLLLFFFVFLSLARRSGGRGCMPWLLLAGLGMSSRGRSSGWHSGGGSFGGGGGFGGFGGGGGFSGGGASGGW